MISVLTINNFKTTQIKKMKKRSRISTYARMESGLYDFGMHHLANLQHRSLHGAQFTKCKIKHKPNGKKKNNKMSACAMRVIIRAYSHICALCACVLVRMWVYMCSFVCLCLRACVCACACVCFACACACL